jgi:hypothetical protein
MVATQRHGCEMRRRLRAEEGGVNIVARGSRLLAGLSSLTFIRVFVKVAVSHHTQVDLLQPPKLALQVVDLYRHGSHIISMRLSSSLGRQS